MQNWPAPRVSEPTYAVASAVDVAVGERAGEDDDRVDRRHLGVDRDRLGARGGRGDQGEPAAAGAGEADRLDPRVGHERLAELDRPCAARAGRRTCRRAGRPCSTARVDRAGDEVAGARVGGVALDHDRAAGGQRGGGVAAGGGEGEREVAGAEDGDRAERDLPLADVGARQRRAVRQGGVDADAEVVAAAYDAGEHPQLAGGAADLAGDARLGQVALGDARPRRSRPCRPRSRRRRPRGSRRAACGVVAR